MAIAVVLVLLVIGSLIFHFASPWWFTPIASNWTTMDDTVVLTFWVTGIVFVLVNLFLAWVVWKYRHRGGQKATYDPENKKLEWWLTIVTSVGVAAMLAPGLFVWGKFVNVPKDAAIVEAIGQRDYFIVQATILFFALIFLVVNLIVDVLYAYLDPKVRLR